ncbi:MAG TPA: hypothetical protein PLF11_14650 [Bacillota bacterium]|nr:hypothetical protein [Bacillota bacterium]
MLSFEPAGIKRALFAVCVSIGLTISSAAISKQKPEPEPPVIWDMDDIKPPTLIEPDPDGMPAVVSAGTPSMSREVFPATNY